ncbi:thermonuclease family protein [Solirubrobacter taibaiensis]|nr:thermonuclease family protein [Solirubrobacter taibaiensis]
MARARRARWAAALAALAVAGCATEAPVADRDCTDFSDQAAAQRHLDADPADSDRLDGNGDGVACDSMTPPLTADQIAPERRGRVVTVIDGDTIKVEVDGRADTVRLVGIDTPESRRPETPVECGSKKAATALRHLVLDRDVVLLSDPTQDAVDKYGRALAYVEVDGRDAGEAMVASGWAKAYVYGGVEFSRVAAYRAAQAAAANRRAGVHGSCGGDFHRAA